MIDAATGLLEAAAREYPLPWRLFQTATIAGVVAFLGINLGLRLIPEGRAFLAEARARGRMTANPGAHAPSAVRAVFAVSLIAAVVAAAATWFLSAPQPSAPVRQPVVVAGEAGRTAPRPAPAPSAPPPHMLG